MKSILGDNSGLDITSELNADSSLTGVTYIDVSTTEDPFFSEAVPKQ